MALGIDSAAHAGAIAGGGATVAVLPGGADRVYPASRRGLHRQICASGVAISELPRVAGIRRWMFPARNRLIAALATATIVVEAAERSGALLTAAVCAALGRPVGAVPGRITSPLAAGPNRLLAGGATVVRGPQDVLELLFGEAARSHVPERRPRLDPELEAVLEAISSGRDSAEALTRSGLDPGAGLAALASLELAGYIRRDPGGRFTVLP
jgi:DNA processing protein